MITLRDAIAAALLVLALAACDWASFSGDDGRSSEDAGADGDADVGSSFTCRGSACVTGGIRSLSGPALRAGNVTVHSTGLEPSAAQCVAEVCIQGGVEP